MTVAAQNELLLKKLLVIILIMGGFGFALVPFYKKICQVTGITATRILPAAVTNTQVDTSRTITIEFVANTNERMPWHFEPQQKSIQVHPGQIGQVNYVVKNTTDKLMLGQAIPSYGPENAGRYLQKLECFCFKQQSLGPHESRNMPVVFLITAELPKDVTTVTLSYTFFDVTQNTAHKS
jgi:cytochrome c oxidase assembly protein subunit 11